MMLNTVSGYQHCASIILFLHEFAFKCYSNKSSSCSFFNLYFYFTKLDRIMKFKPKGCSLGGNSCSQSAVSVANLAVVSVIQIETGRDVSKKKKNKKQQQNNSSGSSVPALRRLGMRRCFSPPKVIFHMFHVRARGLGEECREFTVMVLLKQIYVH